MSPILALLHCGTMTRSHQRQATIPHLKKSSGLPFLEQSKIIAFHQLKAAAEVRLNPAIIAFLASRVWSNLDRANTYVAQEASAIRQSVLLSDALPEDTRMAVRTALRQHLRFIETDD
jgi:hypothetical protein